MSSFDPSVKKGIAIAVALILTFSFGYFIGTTNNIQINHNGVAAEVPQTVTVAPAPTAAPVAAPTAAPVADTTAAPVADTTAAIAPDTTTAPAAEAPAAPDTTAAPAPDTTAAPAAPASSAPTSTAEILKLYNTSANKIKTNAKSVTRNWEDLQHNEEKLVVPSALQAIGKGLINTFLKKDETPIVWSTKEDIAANYPVKGTNLVSSATEADIAEATCTDDGTYYNIKLKFKTCVDPTTNGVGSAFTIMKGEEIMEAAKVVQSFSVEYYDATIEAKIEKSTGNMVHTLYTLPSVLSVTAKVLVSLDAQVGMTFIDDYSIEY